MDTMKKEICVPLKTLSMPAEGEGGENVAPEVGDEVEFEGRGKVTRIDGENAYVAPTEMNGEPMDGEGSEPKDLEEMTGDEGEAELRKRFGKGGDQDGIY